jgi:pimeloyl-ACP methyl ester carboxylesterase
VDATTGSRRILNPIKEDARLLHNGIPTTPLQIESFLNTRRQAIFAQMDEIRHFADSARQVEKAGPLPDVPLMVLSHGRRVWPPGAEGDEREAGWRVLQHNLVSLTPQGQQEVVKNAGHSIQIDAPDAVAAAIRKVAAEFRLRASGYPSTVLSAP